MSETRGPIGDAAEYAKKLVILAIISEYNFFSHKKFRGRYTNNQLGSRNNVVRVRKFSDLCTYLKRCNFRQCNVWKKKLIIVDAVNTRSLK